MRTFFQIIKDFLFRAYEEMTEDCCDKHFTAKEFLNYLVNKIDTQ